MRRNLALFTGRPYMSGHAENSEALIPALTHETHAAERKYIHPYWDFLSSRKKQFLGLLLHLLRTKPHFVAYAQFNLPAAAPLIARYVFGMPLLSWTVRTEKERAHVTRFADQIIFEHIRP